MSEPIAIRAVDAADAEVVAQLFSEFNALVGADGQPEQRAFLPEYAQVEAAQMARRLQSMAGIETAFVAEIGGVAAGLACLRLVPYIGQDVPYAELTQLYVREAFQRRGVGAALLSHVEGIATEAGATCVHIVTGIDNVNAQAFYRDQGYGACCYELEKFFPVEAAHA